MCWLVLGRIKVRRSSDEKPDPRSSCRFLDGRLGGRKVDFLTRGDRRRGTGPHGSLLGARSLAINHLGRRGRHGCLGVGRVSAVDTSCVDISMAEARRAARSVIGIWDPAVSERIVAPAIRGFVVHHRAPEKLVNISFKKKLNRQAINIRWGNGSGGSPNLSNAERRRNTTLRVWAQVRSCLVQAVLNTAGGRGSLNHFDREVVLASTICATFIALMLELLLSLCISEAKQQFDAIVGRHIVKLCEDRLGNFASLESKSRDWLVSSIEMYGESGRLQPGKSDFLANAILFVAADLLGNDAIWFKVTTKVLHIRC